MRIQWLFILVLIAKTAFGQTTFSGSYESGHDFVNFLSDSTLEFKVLYGSCLGTNLYGYGKYTIKKKKIKVNTIRHTSEFDMHYHVLKPLGDSTKIEFYIEDLSSQPIQYCNVVLREENAKNIDAFATADERGYAVLENLGIAQIENLVVELMFMGFETVTIPLKEVLGKSVKVAMSQYEIVADKKVFFEISYESDSTQIVGPEFRGKTLFTTWPWKWRQTCKYRNTSESKIFRKK